jgi:TPP-dependent pyruvate/acetoin dehydrogenase alpha subunit
MMAEMFGKVDGYCKGKGGSMHIADIALGNLGANGIVGAGIPIATGAAFGVKYRGSDRVVICFFGEGASLEGEFHESLNFAGRHKLPIIYVIENNRYCLSTPIDKVAAVENLSGRASAYGFPGEQVDGMDVEAVAAAAGRAVERAREGKGPTLLESLTYRYYGHSRSDPTSYRTKEEEQRWRDRDPIKLYSTRLEAAGKVTSAEVGAMDQRIEEILNRAVEFADGSEYPEPAEIFRDVFVEEGRA